MTNPFVYQVDRIDNNLYLVGEINPQSVNELHQQINKMEKDNNITSFNFYITSDGGHTFEGLKLYDILQNTRLDIIIYVLGFVASAATFLLFTKHKVIMYKNATLSFHELYHWSDNTFSNCKARIGYSERLMDKLVVIYQSKSPQITKEWLITDKYLDASEALEMKIVDVIR
jgi:ATP-dependent protease ClpP protease subunit